MDRDRGMQVLGNEGWLKVTPPEFRSAILSRSSWQSFEPGAPIQTGGEDSGELIGLAEGVIEMRTILGPAETPIMHFAHPPFWFGYVPVFTNRPRRIAVSAKTKVWVGRVSQTDLSALLAATPQWWRHLFYLAIVYGDVSQTVAADLLIRDSERRCAAVLLRLGGRRFPTPDDRRPTEVQVTQGELAGAANLSRNSVGTMLHRLAARGLIELGYRGITVISPAALRALVDEG